MTNDSGKTNKPPPHVTLIQKNIIKPQQPRTSFKFEISQQFFGTVCLQTLLFCIENLVDI